MLVRRPMDRKLGTRWLRKRQSGFGEKKLGCFASPQYCDCGTARRFSQVPLTFSTEVETRAERGKTTLGLSPPYCRKYVGEARRGEARLVAFERVMFMLGGGRGGERRGGLLDKGGQGSSGDLRMSTPAQSHE